MRMLFMKYDTFIHNLITENGQNILLMCLNNNK